MRAALLVLAIVAVCIQKSHARLSSDPDLIIVVGQNDNLTAPAGVFGAPALALMKQIQGWTDAQVAALWNEARAWYSSQFNVTFANSSVLNPAGFPNSPAYSISTGSNAYMIPLVARGYYRVFGAIGNRRLAPPRLFEIEDGDDDDDNDDDDDDRKNRRPAESFVPVELCEFVCLFDDLSNVIPGWTFNPFNYGGVFASQNGGSLASPGSRFDNLPFGVYRIAGHNYYMRTPVPDKVNALLLGTSIEAAQLCSEVAGAGLSSMRVDAFASTPNVRGLFPTSTMAIWHFYVNASRTAFPQLYGFAPKIYTGRSRPSCLASL